MRKSARKRWRGLERVACVVVLERSLEGGLVGGDGGGDEDGCLRPFGGGCSGHGRRGVCGDVVGRWGWGRGMVA